MDRMVCMEAFVRVAEAKSFAEAARRWGRSKTVVSKYISQLEEHLGVALLHRSTRSVALTDAGVGHYENSRQVLSLLAESEAQLQAADGEVSGRLRVSAPAGLLSMGRPPLVASFLSRYPSVELDLDINDQLVDLIEDRIDVAIRVTRPEDSSLIARKLAPVSLLLVASPGYLEAHGVPPTPEALAGHRCLLDGDYRLHPRWPFEVDGRQFHVKVSGAVRANDLFMVIDLALQGQGIALVPRALALPHLRSGGLQEVLPGTVDIAWSVYAVTSQRRLVPARARAFIEHLKRFVPAAFRGDDET